MKEPLAWYIAGPLLGLIVPLLLILIEKQFGVSSSYRYIGSKIFKKVEYFTVNKGVDKWQFHFALGLILAGIYALFFYDLSVDSSSTVNYGKMAATIYSEGHVLYFLIGGIFIGFGARYANGCTAGHCIMGVSQFSVSSIIATVCFFIGGLIASYILIPILL